MDYSVFASPYECLLVKYSVFLLFKEKFKILMKPLGVNNLTVVHTNDMSEEMVYLIMSFHCSVLFVYMCLCIVQVCVVSAFLSSVAIINHLFLIVYC